MLFASLFTLFYYMDEVLSLRFVSKRPAFCMETEGVLYQNGRRFDTKRKSPLRRFGPNQMVFWGKTECVLGQIGLRFGPKRNVICGKTEKRSFAV